MKQIEGRISFAFLEEIHQRFVRTYGRAVLSAQAYGMNDEFSRVLSQQMEYYSNDPNLIGVIGECCVIKLPCWDSRLCVTNLPKEEPQRYTKLMAQSESETTTGKKLIKIDVSSNSVCP